MILDFVDKHFFKLLLLCATLVGILYVAPILLILHDVQSKDQTFLFLQFGDEINQYLARAREVYDGHLLPSDLTFEGYHPTVLNPLPSLIFAAFIFLLHGNVQSAFFSTVFIFSIVIFILCYFVFRAFVSDKFFSLFLALTAVLTPFFRSLPYAFFGFSNILNVVIKPFFPLAHTTNERLPMVRFDDPLLTVPFYLLAVLFLFLFWTNPQKKSAVLAGLFIGLLFYTYFHFWVFFVSILGILFVIVLSNAKQDPVRLKLFFWLLSTLLLFSIPYFINYYFFIMSPDGNDYVSRISQDIFHYFNKAATPYYVAYLIIAGIVYGVYFKKDYWRAMFYFACIAAAIVLWNMQIVTGFNIIPENYGRAIGPLLFIMCANSVIVFVNRDQRKLRIFYAIILILALCMITKKTINALSFIHSPQEKLADYVFNPDIIDSWNWANKHLEKEPRVLSSSYVTSDLLTSYTGARPYMPTGGNSFALTHVLEDRFLTASKVFGVPAYDIQLRLEAEPLGVSWKRPDMLSALNQLNTAGYLYVNYYTKLGASGKPPESKIKELLYRYSAITVDWKTIDADYVYSGPLEKQLSNIDFSANPHLSLVFKNASVEIYKIKK